MTQEHIYGKIKKMFKNSTPLKCDCGVLCDRACCKGDSTTGMILFPNERTNFNVIETNGYKLVVCNGKCNRNERPISCMLFPFMPIIIDNKTKITIDYRGFSICPLVRNYQNVRFSKPFILKVKIAGKLLTKNRESFKQLELITQQILEEKSLIETLNKE